MTQPLDEQQQVAALAVLSKRATPGPWYSERGSDVLPPRFGSEGHRRGVGDYAIGYVTACIGDDQAHPDNDVEFVAAAVNYVREVVLKDAGYVLVRREETAE